MEGALRILRRATPGRPAFDTALSRAILHRVDRGECPETLRLYAPDDVVAFSVVDRRRPGFPAALRIARDAGFGATLRLAGGRAALFHHESLAFAWSRRSADARAEIGARFEECAAWIRDALIRLGVDARIGEVVGEYCPGAFSVNAGGRRKLAGIGQRIVRNAAHVGGVLTVGGRERVLPVLGALYDALDYEFDPETFGTVSGERPDLDGETVAEALLAPLRVEKQCWEPAGWDPEESAGAARLEADHHLGAGG